MPNRLVNETSPYLLQHADNPVDWYPWGSEAFARARREDKPILLSIGYAACHWCHVMERESFENPSIAQLMNALFVNVKVDREERPDIDAVYMDTVQAMTGHGGWPLTVFLTPEGKPFYGGTYFPPTDRPGMPGFPRLLTSVADAYRHRRAVVDESAKQLVDALREHADLRPVPSPLTTTVLTTALEGISRSYDARSGGFGDAPKFPAPLTLELLLRAARWSGGQQALKMVTHTLEMMERGGIHDQIGGGFHRYSVDARWLVPHFEKMLYDNAQLSRVYLLAYQVTGKSEYRRIAEETLDYVRREMTSPEGGFFSAQDADSEGQEGKFYLWTLDELEAVLGSELTPIVARYYGVTAQGNFEGKNILHVSQSPAEVASAAGLSLRKLETLIAGARRQLSAARARRSWPGRDDKIITAWNGLMLRSFADAARILDRADYREVALRNAEFVLARLLAARDGTRLFRTYKDGVARLPGYLEDYTFLADGLIALYEATFAPRWLETARSLMETVMARFADPQGPGFFDTADDHEALVIRPKEHVDNATPAGNSVAADVLLRLSLFFAEPEYERQAVQILESLVQPMMRHPTAFGRLLLAVDFSLAEPREVAIVGEAGREDTRELLRVVRQGYRPYVVVASRSPDDQRAAQAIPLLDGRGPIDGRATAYVCEHYVCQAPTTSPDELARRLEGV
ncbi:MAG: thioredoxin domain-containing protein [Chloroflexi bacterium]|nr:thioredoxin domain-containing protein [Chloroflexota bacterium]